MNQINLIGRVGKDPEVKTLDIASDHNKVAKLSLAVSEKFTRNGEKVEETEWFNLSIFGRLAEIAEKWVKKGDLLRVTGKFKTREYTDKEGNQKRFSEVNVSDLEMLGSKKEIDPLSDDAPMPPDRPKRTEQQTMEQSDDLPF